MTLPEQMKAISQMRHDAIDKIVSNADSYNLDDQTGAHISWLLELERRLTGLQVEQEKVHTIQFERAVMKEHQVQYLAMIERICTQGANEAKERFNG